MTTRSTAAWTLALLLPIATRVVADQQVPNTSDPLVADSYVADFVATAATGAAMNDAGDVAGTSYPDTGCGPFCLPPLETVVWRGGVRMVLPTLPGFAGIYVRGINSQGWVAGLAGFPGTATHAVVWKPNGNSYEAIDLGVLPGTTISEAVGIDNLKRVVGWSTTSSFPPNGSPFMWSESTGLVDLSLQGFPDEPPLAISPGGTVATASAWYQLADPASVSLLPLPPPGFAVGSYATAINDTGDQARFLVSTSAENLVYLFRFHHEGTWQMLSSSGTGHLTTYGIGSINAARDVSATVTGSAVIAPGPNGLAQALASFLSPAYPGSTIGAGGPMNSSGQVLTQVMIGRSQRLMKLTPATACASDCIRVSRLVVRARFVQDPSDPGSCTPDGTAYNLARASLMVTDETGARLGGVLVVGRFLDDYWMNKRVARTTNSQGVVSFDLRTTCGVGALAFLVHRATQGSRAFDRTTGVVSTWAIPQ